MTVFARFKKRFYFVVASYFRFFANFAFKRWSPRVIAITGSVGKTTMLNLVEFELGSRAHYSHDANSAYGIAFDLVGLRGITGSKLRWLYLFFAVPIRSLYYHHREEFYVVEIDGERPHETEFLAEWLRPEVTLWISLGRSHAVQFEKSVATGEFESIDKAITHEFAMLPQYTEKLILIDDDIPLMRKACRKIKQHHQISAEVTGCSAKSLVSYNVAPEHTTFRFRGPSGNSVTCHFYHPVPRSLIIQLLELQHLCTYLDIPFKTDFKNLHQAPGRNSFFPGQNNLKLIDSSYNAHLISVQAILDMSAEMKVKHKWLVLGDMVEQGSIESEEHAKLVDSILKVHPETTILVGRRLQNYTYPLLKKTELNIISVLDVREAYDYIMKHSKGGETIVFKGSQYLEWIIEKLLKDPTDAAQLPRREKAAVKRRQNRGLSS